MAIRHHRRAPWERSATGVARRSTSGRAPGRNAGDERPPLARSEPASRARTDARASVRRPHYLDDSLDLRPDDRRRGRRPGARARRRRRSAPRSGEHKGGDIPASERNSAAASVPRRRSVRWACERSLRRTASPARCPPEHRIWSATTGSRVRSTTSAVSRVVIRRASRSAGLHPAGGHKLYDAFAFFGPIPGRAGTDGANEGRRPVLSLAVVVAVAVHPRARLRSPTHHERFNASRRPHEGSVGRIYDDAHRSGQSAP